jgi:hypothetical protein
MARDRQSEPGHGHRARRVVGFFVNTLVLRAARPIDSERFWRVRERIWQPMLIKSCLSSGW